MTNLTNFTARFEHLGLPTELNFQFDLSKGNHKTVHNFLSNGMFYEPDVTNLMKRALRSGDCAVDIGSNLGCHTLFMSKFVGVTGKVIAFEPDPRNLIDFKNNLAINLIKNITLHEVAVSDGKKKVDLLSYDLDGGWTAVSEGAANNVDDAQLVSGIDAHSLDEMIKWEKVRLVKLDVEGYEGKVLDGAEHLINQGLVDFWIVEYAPHCLATFGEDQWTIRNRFKSVGYDCFVLTRSGQIPQFVPSETKIQTPDAMQNVFVINLLFCKQQKLGEIYPENDFAKFVYG